MIGERGEEREGTDREEEEPVSWGGGRGRGWGRPVCHGLLRQVVQRSLPPWTEP